MITIPGGADIRQVEQRDHGLVCLAQVRAPDGAEWHPMLVRSGQVAVGMLGDMPGRSVTVTVMSWTDETDDVMDYLTPFGSWIRLYHQVIRVGGTVINVPLGYYRVDRLAIDPLDGTIEITGSDVGSLVADYALTTLGQGQVTTAQTYLDRLRTMLVTVLGPIPPWWSILWDPGTADAALKPRARVQYTGSRVDAAADLARRLGQCVASTLDGRAAFRLVAPRDATDASDITVRGGVLGNLETMRSQMTREGIVNTGLVLYTREVKVAGARTRVEQRRIIRQYANTDADTSVESPFGIVTVDIDSKSVDDDTAANAAADKVLKASLTQVRDVALEVSPIYGLEAGDIIRMEDAQGIATKGILVGATIGLTAADTWALTVRTFVPVGRWSGKRTTVLTDAYEIRDDADWKDFPSKSVDLTGASTKGWTAAAGAIKDGGSAILFTATGAAGASVSTGNVWSVPSSHRLRVKFGVKYAGSTDKNAKPTGTIRARAWIDPNASGRMYGPWVDIPWGKSKSVGAELEVGAGATFAVGVALEQVKPAAGNLTAGTTIRVSNVNVEKAVRKQ